MDRWLVGRSDGAVTGAAVRGKLRRAEALWVCLTDVWRLAVGLAPDTKRSPRKSQEHSGTWVRLSGAPALGAPDRVFLAKASLRASSAGAGD